MALEWSFSTDRRIRRCQRQFFFGSVAAWHNAKDPLRRASFLLSQVKGMDAWRGNLVHEAIRSFVVPSFEARQAIPGERVIEEARKLGRNNDIAQFACFNVSLPVVTASNSGTTSPVNAVSSTPQPSED